MHISPVIVLALLGCSSVSAFGPWTAPQSSLGALESQHTPRPVTEADLDDFVDVYVDAFAPGEVAQYLKADNGNYRNYTWTCIRQELQRAWGHLHNTTSVNVIAVPLDEHRRSRERNERVVSIAVWNWKEPGDSMARPSISTLGLGERCFDEINTNMTRAKDFAEKMDRATKPYLSNATESQLWLNLLATHPDWDGHGFGASQVEVGLERAALADVPVTLMASPAGYPLYRSLDFRSIANVTVEMLDGLGVLWHEYMRWDAADG